MAPPTRAEVLRVLYWNPHFRQGARRHLPPRRGSAAGTLCAPHAGKFRDGAGGCRFGGQRGGQGRKMAICATLCYTEISSRRVDRVLCWGVNSAVFGVQWGACPLPETPDLAVVARGSPEFLRRAPEFLPRTFLRTFLRTFASTNGGAPPRPVCYL